MALDLSPQQALRITWSNLQPNVFVHLYCSDHITTIQRSSRCQGADSGTLGPRLLLKQVTYKQAFCHNSNRRSKNAWGIFTDQLWRRAVQCMSRRKVCLLMGKKIHGHETKLIIIIKVAAGLTRWFHEIHSISQAGTRHALNMMRCTVSPNCKFKDKQNKKRWGCVWEHFLIHLSLQHYCLIRNCCYPIL